MPIINIGSAQEWNDFASSDIGSTYSTDANELYTLNITSDIDFSGVELVPILFNSAPTGKATPAKLVINGNGHTIKNISLPLNTFEKSTGILYILRINVQIDFTIRDLRVLNIDMRTSSICSPFFISSFSKGGKLYNVHTHGKLEGSYVGGIIYLDSSGNIGSFVKDCTTNIQAKASSMFAGICIAGNTGNYPAEIINCHTYGTVELSGNRFYGICNYGRCYSCSSHFHLKGTAVSGMSFLVMGIADGTSTDCYATGLYELTDLYPVYGISSGSIRCYCTTTFNGGGTVYPIGDTPVYSVSLSPSIKAVTINDWGASTEPSSCYGLDTQERITPNPGRKFSKTVSLSEAMTRDFYKSKLKWDI
ncbi:hypothetical protein P9E76_15495 [Schinkia azotoformans]|uniref:GLUG domain-containing protein n=1 Tax=Schinkia azotoformans LMG 9581 TaxID=1131731 RepID=K6DJ06_SCHAZ|nr:hypothetical protein [Schinkia azotoformans]EKN68078.1 hypothetical protein BAZO_06159 [Schinkia azotoformans LMG 9581]MEC1638117.1 hypothetical protein [Schinkia azotoformans]MEC1946449.1 hypothetical protein [Schinkia azotoformans]